ncbi:MAG: type A2 lanthipeptide [Bryobacteraceae bacterium]
MEDQKKIAADNAPPSDDQEITQELSKEELDGVAGGNNGGSSGGPLGPHH